MVLIVTKEENKIVKSLREVRDFCKRKGNFKLFVFKEKFLLEPHNLALYRLKNLEKRIKRNNYVDKKLKQL